jgi:hypothetical protein
MLKKAVEKFGRFIFVYIFVRSIRHNIKTNAMKNREIALVVLESGQEITVVSNQNESIQQCLIRKNIKWVKYLPI